jgi:hypothetical protein
VSVVSVPVPPSPRLVDIDYYVIYTVNKLE